MFSTNPYFCECWKQFFPHSSIPVTDNEFVGAIIATGNKLKDRYDSLFEGSYVPVYVCRGDVDYEMEQCFITCEKVRAFESHLAALCSELDEVTIVAMHRERLVGIYTTFIAMVKMLEDIERKTEKAVKFLRYVNYRDRASFTRYARLVNKVKNVAEQATYSRN